MSRFSRLAKQIKRDMRSIVKSNLLNTVQVTVVWSADQAAPGPDFNANVESTYPEVAFESGTWPGLFHTIAPTTSEVRRFAEVQAGDAIIDFIDDVPLSGKNGVTFVIDGQEYVQKKMGGELSDYWDLRVSNERIFRSVLVTRKNGA